MPDIALALIGYVYRLECEKATSAVLFLSMYDGMRMVPRHGLRGDQPYHVVSFF